MMTFEAFQATRIEVTDLGYVMQDECLAAQPGLLYLDSLYIEKETAGWSDPTPDCGDYLLLLENCDWRGRDLAAMERRLYEWAMMAGYGD